VSDGARFVRPSLDQLLVGDPAEPFAPGSALLGLNEGLDGPFPSALAAMESTLPWLNRYPARGSYELVATLAERHGVETSQVLVAAGADAVIGYVCQAVLDLDDEVVVPWPSFPSFVRDPQKRDAVPVTVPLTAGSEIDLAGLAAAVTQRTRLVFVATPNNPTGLAIPRDDLIAFVRDLPEHVLPVIDEAYFDYLEPGDRLDSIDDLFRRGVDVLVLRTFSKLYGLAGLRIGYGVGPAAVVAAMRKVQRGYDVGALAQVAARASLDDPAEVERRRAANREAIEALTAVLRGRGLEPLAGSVTNFVLVDVDTDADELTTALARNGVVVQSGTPFGAPTSLRIGAGSSEELARLDAALVAVLTR
jgi:histidinol-phosphate aminotransferase